MRPQGTLTLSRSIRKTYKRSRRSPASVSRRKNQRRRCSLSTTSRTGRRGDHGRSAVSCTPLGSCRRANAHRACKAILGVRCLPKCAISPRRRGPHRRYQHRGVVPHADVAATVGLGEDGRELEWQDTARDAWNCLETCQTVGSFSPFALLFFFI